MNENDMDRYRWRTGQPWSGDNRPASESYRRTKIGVRVMTFVGLSFLVTLVGLVLLR
jgi:hypothetical protein